MNFEFRKSNRLLKKAEFDEVLEQGTKIVRPSMVLVGIQTVGDEDAKLGFIVSKKVGNAVERNRLKRVIREKFRHLKHQYPGLRVVLIGRAKANSVENATLADELEAALSRLSKKIQSS